MTDEELCGDILRRWRQGYPSDRIIKSEDGLHRFCGHVAALQRELAVARRQNASLNQINELLAEGAENLMAEKNRLQRQSMEVK